MPTIVDTPSKGCAVRSLAPAPSDQDISAVFSRDELVAGPSGADNYGSHSVRRIELIEDPSFWKDHNVQVIIRVRPLNSTEISLQGQKRCVRQDSYQSISWTGHPESRFTFDLVADEFVSQEKLFKVAGVPMVDNCVSGYNSCMFAYGQTGSGKTHTMLGDIEGGTRRHSANCGMTPRVFEYLFSKIQKEKEVRKEEKLQFVCKCSFLEIYNEHILDLLDPSSSNLQIREDLKKGVHVENLSEFEVSSARDVIQHLLQGAANRKVAATNMNRASSRSHSVFTCVIESKWESQGITHHRFSRLNLVDLAGSERQKSSGAEGERLKEATNINKSLSTLGLVIMNLVGISNKKSLHVPYRDSKLTFLLQESLGGNSKTTIIANISPSNSCALETLSTLKFAQRAKFIKNNAIVNEEASGDVFSMRLEIQELKKELSRLRSLQHKKEVTENTENDDASSHALGSPSYFNWDGFQGSFSPLAVDRRSSKKKDFEAALAAAFRREMEKEKALKALAAEKEAAEQLANQVNDEVNSLKMRIRFREEGIKRLQAVVAGKLSADSHLVQEKEELLKEIEILRAQVDCNPKVTSFAMENLRLKEQVRRLEYFVEEGEREMMNEQINDLQEKLLDALDWKLMHEKDSGFQDLSQSWDPSSLSEENEFLRMQAIQNEKEVETLRKNLSFCMESREKLERRVDELTLQLAEAARRERDSHDELRDNKHQDDDHQLHQDELKAMVDAIAAASQREAEAHEMAILLARENEELRSKLALLVDENNRLILLSESALPHKLALEQEQEHHKKEDVEEEEKLKEADDLRARLQDLQEENEKLIGLYESALSHKLTHEQEQRKQEEDLEKMLQETDGLRARLHYSQEENEKLMGLYDYALSQRLALEQERQRQKEEEEDLKKEQLKEADDLRARLLELQEENEKLMGLYEFTLSQKLTLEQEQQKQEEEDLKKKEKLQDADDLRARLGDWQEDNEKLMGLYVSALFEKLALELEQKQQEEENLEEEKVKEADYLRAHLLDLQEEKEKLMGLYEAAMQERDDFKKTLQQQQLEDKDEENIETEPMEEEGTLEELEEKPAAGKLCEETVEMLTEFWEEMQRIEKHLRVKKEEISSLRTACREAEYNRKMTEEMLLHLMRKASSFALPEFDERLDLEKEELTQRELDCYIKLVAEKTAELRRLLSLKEEASAGFKAALELETQLRAELTSLKAAYREAVEQRKETKKVLFPIENMTSSSGEGVTMPVRKAFELLTAEEELPKLAGKIKSVKERIVAAVTSVKEARLVAEKLEEMVKSAEAEVSTSAERKAVAEAALQETRRKKERVAEGRALAAEAWDAAADFQEMVFMVAAKEEELMMCEEDLVMNTTRTGRLESLMERCRAGTLSLRRIGVAGVHP